MINPFRTRMKHRVTALAYLVPLSLLLLQAVSAAAVAGAGYTTTSDGSAVNANHYQDKCDVYINGGPNNGVSALTDGNYFFTVLAPGGQLNPNDGSAKNLSDDFDTTADRTFTVSGNHITAYSGTHDFIPDPSTSLESDFLIGLCPYADTTNPGGVYILAICNVDSGTPVDPRSCKYDAFKVRTKGKPKTDLAISKTAVPSFSRTNAWEIDKTLESLSLNQQTSQATLEYTIEWTKTTTNTDYQVTGIILVANANDATATEVVVTDQIGSTSCSVTPPDGFDGTIAPQDELTFAYVCNFESAQSGSATNVATVTWTKSSIGSPNSSATASVGFTWPTNATTTTGPESVSIVDIFDGGSPETLVASTSTSGSTTLTKTKTITTPAACTEIVNIARAQFVNDVGQVVVVAQDSVTTEVCVNEGGFTMGFWRNPNGQALIKSANQTDLCSYLQQYSNVLPDLLVCSDIAAYVTGLIDTADASGSGIAMFKAQFLATALSAYFDPDLASTSIVVDSTLFNPSAGDCMTVSELLSAADSSYLTLETDKTDLLTVKDYFDGINNNLAFTC